jgi:glycosyltransferase involved in cell wall biosynthesis
VPRLLLCTQPIDGGVGRHIRDLLAGLSERGWEVCLCAPAIPLGSIAPITHITLAMKRSVAPRADMAGVRALARIIRQLRPDIVHAHSSKAGALVRLARIAHPTTPVVYTPHGYAFAGHLAHRSERHLYRGIERVLAPLSSRVVCVCEAEASVARSIGAPGRVRVVYNGIESAGEGPSDPRIAKLSLRGPVIGALTLLRPGKGLETLIDALPQVLAAHEDAQLAICGDGPDLKALMAQAQTRGVGHAMHFLGPSSDPLAVLRAIDVFVHPSWAEAFPYVILEAMSAGRPVVATEVGGIGEALVDGESGMLVPKGDPDALAQALVGLLDDPRRRAQMGALARRRVDSHFTLNVMIDRLVGVYDELMSSSPRDDPSRPAHIPIVAERPPTTMTGPAAG